MADSSENLDSSEVDDNTCEDQLSEYEIEKMEEKFNEYKRTRSDFPDYNYDGWDDSPKEEKYWISRFKEEYMKLGDESEISDRELVVDINEYIDWATQEKLLGSDEYPDKYHCFELMHVAEEETAGHKAMRVKATLRFAKEEIEDAKRDDDFDDWSKEDKDKMHKKLIDYVDKYYTKNFSNDNSYEIELDDDLKEFEYWLARFHKEYKKTENWEHGRREYLTACIYSYLQKFASHEQLKGLTDPSNDDFMRHLKI